MAPTLVTACTALPPEGALLAWDGPALADKALTLVTACTVRSPEGTAALEVWRGQSRGFYLNRVSLRGPVATTGFLFLAPKKIQPVLEGTA